MDSTSILKQHTIFIKIISFLKPFKNIGLKSTPPLALPTLLGTAILISLHLYYGVIMYLNFIICSIF